MGEHTMTIERRATLAAPAERILPLLVDFREWQQWSPWEGLDPNLTRTYSGAERGVGAVYEWSGNRKAGQGRMEIIAVEPDRRVEIDLSFIKPFRSQNSTIITLAPTAEGTEVVWTMVAPVTLMTRIAGVFMDMDKMIGKDFERGLASLGSAVAS